MQSSNLGAATDQYADENKQFEAAYAVDVEYRRSDLPDKREVNEQTNTISVYMAASVLLITGRRRYGRRPDSS
jgi:hypothetical protein